MARTGSTLRLALIRGINVGGRKPVAMADLRAMLERMGFGRVRSLLQTGNLVFEAGAGSRQQLEGRLEAEAEKRLGLRAAFFVRGAAEWGSLVSANPFAEEARRDPGRLVVLLLKRPPVPASIEALRAAITGREQIRVHGDHAYAVYPDGQGRSRLTNALIEKALATRATARNWNTVLKLAALASGPPTD